MKRGLLTAGLLAALAASLLPGLGWAEPAIVPALPGAVLAQLEPEASAKPDTSQPATPRSAEEVRRDLQQVNEHLAKLRGALPPPGTAPVAGVGPVHDTPVAAASATAASKDAIASLRAVPPAPTTEEVARLERRLRSARAQLKTDAVTEAGLVTVKDASALRARVVFPYTDGSIYEIYAAPDRMTAIELQPGEVITTDNGKPKAADTVQWVADTVTTGEGRGQQIIVMVKPVVSGVETNLLIPTNRHLYSILLRAESETYMPRVAFNYPFDEAREGAKAAAVAAAAETQHESVSVAPENMNFAYRIKGAQVVWKPLRVFDDGSKTYLQMPPAMKSWEAPALFVMDEGSAPQLVNYRVKGDYYIVDRLFHKAQLRVGIKHFVDISRDEASG